MEHNNVPNTPKPEIRLEAHVVANATATAQLTTKTYPQILLSTAEDLLQQGKYGIAVVVAHMACEVATERSLSESFSQIQAAHLEAPVLAFMNGYSLAAEKNRDLYTALTGDAIQQQPFWQEFKASASRRNKIMHEGLSVGAGEAQASISAARAFVNHLGK